MSANESGFSANLLLPDDEEVAKATVIQKEEEGEEEEQGRSSTVDGALDVSILKGRVDSYKGIIVEPSSLPVDVPTFERCLKASLQQWRHEKRRGIWLKLPIKNVDFVAPAVEAGFSYHHAEPTYVMLSLWLPDTPSTLPANASHQVGVGAFVLNDKQEVLAVQERNGPLKGTSIWKMPTGIINQGEDIFVGAIREVKEETGVDAEFVEVVGFRQVHHVAFEKSDLFFLCILRPLSSIITKQDSEIAAAQWMPLAEFKAQPFFQNHTMLRKMLDVCILSAQGHYKGFTAHNLHTGFQPIPSFFYCNE